MGIFSRNQQDNRPNNGRSNTYNNMRDNGYNNDVRVNNYSNNNRSGLNNSTSNNALGGARNDQEMRENDYSNGNTLTDRHARSDAYNTNDSTLTGRHGHNDTNNHNKPLPGHRGTNDDYDRGRSGGMTGNEYGTTDYGRNGANKGYTDNDYGRSYEGRGKKRGLFGGRNKRNRSSRGKRAAFDVDSGQYNRKPSFGQWIKFTWLDILTMVIMGIIGLGVYQAQPAPSRSFPITFQDGEIVYPQFAYPLRKEIVPIWAAALLASLIPIIVILLMQIRIRSFWDVNNAIIGLLYSLISAAVFQVFLKWLIGGLRPHFLTVCDPDPALVSGSGNGFKSIMFNRDVCRGNGKLIDDSLESFPSGHSTAAWGGFLFLYFYLNAKLKVFSNYHTPLWKQIVLYAPLLAATLITGALTIDEFHNWYDCLAGAIIGSVMALSAYRMVYASVWDFRFNHIPLTRHTPFSYGAGPAGAGGFESAVFTRSAGWGFEEAYGGAPFDAAHGLRGQATGFNTGAQGLHHGGIGMMGRKKDSDVEHNAVGTTGYDDNRNNNNNVVGTDGTSNVYHNTTTPRSQGGFMSKLKGHGKHENRHNDRHDNLHDNVDSDNPNAITGRDGNYNNDGIATTGVGHHNRRNELDKEGVGAGVAGIGAGAAMAETSRHHHHHNNNNATTSSTGEVLGPHNRNDNFDNRNDNLVNTNNSGAGGKSTYSPYDQVTSPSATHQRNTSTNNTYNNNTGNTHGGGILSSIMHPGQNNRNDNYNSTTGRGTDGDYVNDGTNRNSGFGNDANTPMQDGRYHHTSRSLERKRAPPVPTTTSTATTYQH